MSNFYLANKWHTPYCVYVSLFFMGSLETRKHNFNETKIYNAHFKGLQKDNCMKEMHVIKTNFAQAMGSLETHVPYF